MTLAVLNQQIIECRRCPRLVAWREEVARVKRRAFREQTYWGKPAPSFGDPQARVVIVGLAPGAHGANRTGRMFTGDRSGDFLYRALYEAGFANQSTSEHLDDGLRLTDAWITAGAHCAPPDNKPTVEEFHACGQWLQQELVLLRHTQVVVCLGRLALDAWRAATEAKAPIAFGHNLLHDAGKLRVLTSYHPSQQNTSTGRLTQVMLNEVFTRARSFLLPPGPKP
jgi:uracil-DNA glycosylase